MTVTLDDVRAVREQIAGGVAVSPCPESPQLSELCGARIFCKLDYLQRTGSFKERGARNAAAAVGLGAARQGRRRRFGRQSCAGLAYHGGLLSIGVTVVMPRFAPLIKVATCRRLGAKVVLHGDTFGDAVEHAHQLALRDGLTYIHGFNDPAIIAGQGTLGLEILEQVPDVEAIVIPIGGGGLAAGVGVAVKGLKPDVRVIGVEAAADAVVHRGAAGRQAGRCAAATDFGRWPGGGLRG